MTWLRPAITATLTSTVILALVYWYLYRQDGERYLKIWAVSWSIYAVRYGFALWNAIHNESAVTVIGNQTASLISGVLLLWGTYVFMDRPAPSKGWAAGSLLGVAWIVIAVLADLSFLVLTLPTFIFLGIVYVWTGIVLLRVRPPPGLGRHVVGWAFIGWGIHKVDFPFLRPIAGFAPWGYLLAAILELIVAVGILLIYFEKMKDNLRESEQQYRTVFNNAQVGLYRTRISDGKLLLANDRMAEMFGYASREQALAEYVTSEHYVDPDTRGRLLAILEEHGEFNNFEARLTQRDGTVRWYQYSGRLVAEEGYIEGVATDITERKQAEEELRQHREHLEELVAERTHELQERVAEVQELNATMLDLLDDLRAANRRATENAERLAAANADLEAFVYSVSHDLRAPLRSINGFAQIIARRHCDNLNEEGRHYFDNIVEASRHMSELIDDLLRYSRLGRKAVRRQPVPLRDVIDQALDNLIERVGTTDARLDLPADYPVVAGDPTLLGQIFRNLLDNALTYHAPDVAPEITVDWETENDHVVVRVADNGIGIPAEYQDKIFTIFQRLHSQDDYAGTGIGLAIVKKSVDLLGGDVWVESAEGEGSVFSVKLPLGSEQ